MCERFLKAGRERGGVGGTTSVTSRVSLLGAGSVELVFLSSSRLNLGVSSYHTHTHTL